MPSSTSRRASFDRRVLAMLFGTMVGAPLLWLVALQSGYILAYQACDDRSTSWVVAPTVSAGVLALGVVGLAARAYRRTRADSLPLPFLSWVALGVAVMMVVVLAASNIAPLVLQPCD